MSTDTVNHQPSESYQSPPRKLCWLAVASPFVAFCILAPAGAIMGHVAKRHIRERKERGNGWAFAGIIIGWVGTALWLLTLLLLVGTNHGSSEVSASQSLPPTQSQPAASPSAMPSASASQSAFAPLVPYKPAAGSCVYQTTDAGVAWLWVKSTNPQVCQLMASGAAYNHGGGFITFAVPTRVPAATNATTVYQEDSSDANGNNLPNSVTAFTEPNMPMNGTSSILATTGELVADTISNTDAISAAPPAHSATSFRDSNPTGGSDGSFFIVGTAPGDIAPGTWHSNGDPGNYMELDGDACTFTVYGTAAGYNQDITLNQGTGSGAEVADGNNTPTGTSNTMASMNMSVTTGNLVLVNGGCTWNLVNPGA